MTATSAPGLSASEAGLVAYHPLRAWWVVAVLMAVQVASLVQRHILSLLIVDIRRDLGLSDFQISLLQGLAFTAFYCLSAVVVGGLADRYPTKKIIYGALTISSLAAAVTGTVQSYWGMIVTRMITGGGGGGANPPAQVLIASSFPKDRVSLPMSLYSVAGAIGVGLAYFCGGMLLDRLSAHPVPGLSQFAPWRQVLIVTSLPGLLIAFLSLTLCEPRRNSKGSTSIADGWRGFASFLASDRQLFSRFAIGYGLASVMTYAVFTWAPTYARRVLELTPSQTGLEMGLISVFGSILAGALYGYVVDRQFSRGKIDFVLKAFTAGTVIAVPVCAFGFIVNQHAAFVAALIAVQCLLAAAFGPGVAAILMVTRPEMRGKMGAVVIVIVNLFGYAVGPLAVGALTDFFFGDPQKVGLSIAFAVLVLGPISGWSIWTARPYFVVHVRRENAADTARQ